MQVSVTPAMALDALNDKGEGMTSAPIPASASAVVAANSAQSKVGNTTPKPPQIKYPLEKARMPLSVIRTKAMCTPSEWMPKR